MLQSRSEPECLPFSSSLKPPAVPVNVEQPNSSLCQDRAELTAGPCSPHAGMPKRRRHCDKQPQAQCGKVCPACDVSAHNHYRYISFLSLERIKVQMHWREESTPLTLGVVAEFYKMTVDQVIRYSCAAFLPDDLRTADVGPGCNCKWLQKGMFGYSGQDITSPRDEKVLEDPKSGDKKASALVFLESAISNTAFEMLMMVKSFLSIASLIPLNVSWKPSCVSMPCNSRVSGCIEIGLYVCGFLS